MTQNACKCVIAVSLFSACTLASVPLLGQAVTVPVDVVNTPNVNVVNTPNMSVTNTPNVSVTNTPSVNVANTPNVTLEAGASVNITSPLDGEGDPTPWRCWTPFSPTRTNVLSILMDRSLGAAVSRPFPQENGW